jgi:hypothetical protein
VNRSSHDFSAAQRYGELHFLSEGPISKYAVTKIYRQFAEDFRQSTPDDYVMISGLTVMVSIACASFAFLHGGRLNLLIFKDGKYVERKLMLSELLTIGRSYAPSEKEQIDALTRR